jgi:competence protein ComEC
MLACTCVISSRVISSHVTNISTITKGALLGFIWATIMGYWYTTWQLAPQLFNENLIIEGQVSTVSSGVGIEKSADTLLKNQNEKESTARFNMSLTQIGKFSSWMQPTVSLSWYDAPFIPMQGQRLRLLVNLKAPNGLANPHSFHYQTWLASQNVVATGHVRNSPSNALVDARISLRQRSVTALGALELSHEGWLQALSFGYRSDLSAEDWTLLQGSGSAHLFAISGLHVSIVFAYCIFLFARPLALLLGLVQSPQFHLSKIVGGSAAIVCLLYGYLAGFQVPVLRAVLALLLWVYLNSTGSHWRMPSVLLYLLAAFFILFPFSILSISFWFSFSAVLSIWLFVWRFMPNSRLSFTDKLKYGLYLQLWLSIITLPLTLYVFQQLPLFALFANMLLVPWVSVVIVPLCVLASTAMMAHFYFASPAQIYEQLFTWADQAMVPTLWIMQKTVDATSTLLKEQNLIQHIRLEFFSLSALILVLLVCILPFLHLKKCLLFCIFTNLLVKSYASPPSEQKLVIFDVGQGSAALFTKRDEKGHSESWLFDTGASFRSGFSMVQAVILPYLAHYQITTLNKVFLSHLDNDHAGGINVIDAQVSIDELLTPQHGCVRESFSENETSLGNIKLEVLWPFSAQHGQDNAHSCVVKLSVNQMSILFAGDIEHAQEQQILNRYHDTDTLAANILIVPHHGSRTSSTKAFIDAVAPEYAVFSAAKPNRWDFPHPQVLQRYRDVGSRILQTGEHGSIEFTFNNNTITQRAYRKDIYNRWYFKAPN